MKNKFFSKILVLAIFLAVSCDIVFKEYEVSLSDFEEPEFKPCLGLYGFPDATKPGLGVDLFRLLAANQYTFDSLTNVKSANIRISENEKEIAQLNYSVADTAKEGQIFPNYDNKTIKFIPGKTYTINVTAENFPEISAQTVVPLPVKIDSATACKGKEFDEEGYHFKLYFTDPPGDNFFMIKLKHTINFKRTRWNGEQSTIYYDTIPKIRNVIFPIDDPVFNVLPNHMTSLREPFDISNQKPRIFSDKSFANQQYMLEFFLPYAPGGMSENHFQSNSIIHLYSISPELFEGMKSHYLQKTINGDIYAEPMTIYSNVENGFGLWGSMSCDSIIVPLYIPNNRLAER